MIGLTKKNFKTSQSELRSLVNQFGFEAERHLIKTVFAHIDFAHDARQPGSLQQQVSTIVHALELGCQLEFK